MDRPYSSDDKGIYTVNSLIIDPPDFPGNAGILPAILPPHRRIYPLLTINDIEHLLISVSML
jgi:hypothetical protein